jgi:hypothetical protein
LQDVVVQTLPVDGSSFFNSALVGVCGSKYAPSWPVVAALHPCEARKITGATVRWADETMADFKSADGILLPGRRHESRELPKIELGGGEQMDRLSTTSVGAWMSPPVFIKLLQNQ